MIFFGPTFFRTLVFVIDLVAPNSGVCQETSSQNFSYWYPSSSISCLVQQIWNHIEYFRTTILSSLRGISKIIFLMYIFLKSNQNLSRFCACPVKYWNNNHQCWTTNVLKQISNYQLYLFWLNCLLIFGNVLHYIFSRIRA